MFSWRRGFLCFAIAVFACVVGPAAALSSPPGNAFRFFHDADGRLKAAIDPEGDTATYEWDAGGNLLSIARSASSDLSIAQLAPSSGEAGDTIEINGTGFSSNPGSNTVKFNGTAATVKAATPWSLTVEIPAEVTSGPVTVQTPGEGPVTSAQNFTVATGGPAISALEPRVAAAGESVTVSGSGFDPSVAGNVVGLNGTQAEVVSASTSSVGFNVPSERLGGPISLATPKGSAVGPDLFVPPGGVTTGNVGATGRLTSGSAKTVSLVGSSKVALMLLDADAGERLTVRPSESTIGGTISIWSPSGSQLTSGGFSASMIGPITIPKTGTYTVMFAPSSSGTGSVKTTATLFEDTAGTLTPSKAGDTETATISTPGQKAVFSIAGTAGQRLSFKTSNAAIPTDYYYIQLRNPAGSVISSRWWWGTNSGYWNAFELPTTGTYKLEIFPEDDGTGSVDVTAYEAPDITGQTITPTTGGQSKTLSIEVPGQRNKVTFEGTAGQRITMTGSEATFGGSYRVLKPNGSEVSGSGGGLTAFRVFTLPETATYTIMIEGSGAEFGSFKLTAYTFEDTAGTLTPSKAGDTETATISTPGQKAVFSIAGTAGQRLSFKTSNAAIPTDYYYIQLRNPAGSVISSRWWWGTNSGYWNAFELPTTGTYKLEIFPEDDGTGSVDVTAYEAPDITGQTITPTTGGQSKTLSIEVPGQRNKVTFEGTAGQRITMTGSEATFGGSYRVLKPNGSEVSGSGGGLTAFRVFTLPETATYTIMIEGSGAEFGSFKLTAYTFEDTAGTLTPSKAGDTETATISTPGQKAVFSIAGTAGQRLSFKTSNAAIPTDYYYIQLRNPAGSVISSRWWWGTNSGYWNAFELPTTGTYKLEIFPEDDGTGSVDVTAYEAPDITGQTITPTTGGQSKTLSIEVPGQRNKVTFEGTAGQRITMTGSEATFGGSYRVLKPNGSEVSGSGGGLTAFRVFTLPETATYTIMIEGSGAEFGSFKLTAYTFEDTAGTLTPSKAGDTETATISTPGQKAVFSIAGTAGQRLSFKTSNAAIPTDYYYIQLRNPAGSVISSRWWWGTNSGYWNAFELPTTGTYKLEIFPEDDGTGSVDVTAYEAPDITGQTITPSTEGSSVTSTLIAPAQRELVTFSGTSGQVVTLKVTEPTFAGSMSTRSSSGSVVSGSEKSFSSAGTAKAEITLPATGTYTTRLEGSGAEIGSLKLTGYLGPHVSWLAPTETTTEFVSLMSTPDLKGEGYSDIPVAPAKEPANRSEKRPDTAPPKPAPPAGEKVPSANGVTPEMRAFDPAAVKIWHPPRHVPGWEAAEPKTPWAEIKDLRAPTGKTALAGQVLQRNGVPLSGVSLLVKGTSLETRTDEAGRFLLSGLPAGDQSLIVDGETAADGRRYGSYEVSVELTQGKTTVLDYTVWMTPLDPEGNRRVASPTRSETSLTTPAIPGLEVRIPKGTVVTDSAGKRVRDLNITAVPVNQAPFPLPPFVPIPVYFTMQPGGAYLSKGAQIIYPNWGTCDPVSAPSSGTTTPRTAAGTSTAGEPSAPTGSRSSPTRAYGCGNSPARCSRPVRCRPGPIRPVPRPVTRWTSTAVCSPTASATSSCRTRSRSCSSAAIAPATPTPTALESAPPTSTTCASGPAPEPPRRT